MASFIQPEYLIAGNKRHVLAHTGNEQHSRSPATSCSNHLNNSTMVPDSIIVPHSRSGAHGPKGLECSDATLPAQSADVFGSIAALLPPTQGDIMSGKTKRACWNSTFCKRGVALWEKGDLHQAYLIAGLSINKMLLSSPLQSASDRENLDGKHLQ